MNQVRSPEQIEQEISLLRAQIDHTLDAVQEKLSPGELLDQALTYVKDETGVFAGNFGRAVRDNPVPAALLGISLAWLMVGTRAPPRRPERDVYRDGSSGWDGWGRPTGEVASAAGDIAEHARGGLEAVSARAAELGESGRALLHKGEQATHRVSERVTQLRPNLKARTSGIADETTERLRQARDQARARFDATRSEVVRGSEAAVDFMKSNPMTMIAVALAAGALAAALLPRTRREDELMGEHRDELMDRAGETVKETASALAAPLVEVADRTVDETAKAVEETTYDVAAGASDDRQEDAQEPPRPENRPPIGSQPITP